MKFLMLKCGGNDSDFYAALSEWRNMPQSQKDSPFSLMFGRRGKTELPGSGSPKISEFNIGDTVWIQSPKYKTWDTKGKIIGLTFYSDMKRDSYPASCFMFPETCVGPKKSKIL